MLSFNSNRVWKCFSIRSLEFKSLNIFKVCKSIGEKYLLTMNESFNNLVPEIGDGIFGEFPGLASELNLSLTNENSSDIDLEENQKFSDTYGLRIIFLAG